MLESLTRYKYFPNWSVPIEASFTNMALSASPYGNVILTYNPLFSIPCGLSKLARTANVDIQSKEYDFGNYVTGVDFSTDVKTFTSKITLGEGLTMKLTNASGKEVTSGNVGTGMRLTITDSQGTVVGAAQIVIRGDCDGDGTCGLSDLLKIRKQIVGLEKYGGAQLKGLDANKDDSVGLADLLAFRKHIVGIDTIEN